MDTGALLQSCLVLMFETSLLHGGSLAVPALRLREPEFGPGPDKVTHAVGERARLHCSVTHLGERTVTWRKVPDTNPLTIGTTTWMDDPRVTVDHMRSETQWDLIIQDLKSRDAGKYECQVSLRRKLLGHVVELEVKDILISGKQFVPNGGNISLFCKAGRGSNPQRMLTWFKGSQEMAQDGRRVYIHGSGSHHIRDLVTSSLHILGAHLDDSGLYSCRARNEQLMTSAYVSVLPGGSNNVKRGSSKNISQDSGVGVTLQSAKTVVVFLVALQYSFT